MYLALSGSPGRRTASAYSPCSARTWIGMARDSTQMREDSGMPRLVEDPPHDQVLAFCAREPIERVFLEEMAVRAVGRFVALVGDDGQVQALCHAGANLVPSGRGCEEFAEAAIHSNARMIIGEERAVKALWDASAPLMPVPRENRPGQPVYAITE